MNIENKPSFHSYESGDHMQDTMNSVKQQFHQLTIRFHALYTYYYSSTSSVFNKSVCDIPMQLRFFFTIKCFPGPLLLQNYIQSFIKSLLLFNQYLTGSLGLHFHKSAPLCFLGNVVVVVVIELHIANRVLYSTYLSLVLILFSIGVSARPVGPIVS